MKEAQLSSDVQVYWSPIDIDKVTVTKLITIDFSDAKSILTCIANGLTQVALRIFGMIGLHYTGEMFMILWMGKMMPNAFGVHSISSLESLC